MKASLQCLTFLVLFLGVTSTYALEIYLLDMSAGTLIVTPQGETILIDAGHKVYEERDVERIRKVVVDIEGLDRIDHLVITHFHTDHFGAVRQLAKTLPIGRVYDHGPIDDIPEDPNDYKVLYPEYIEASDGKRTGLTPGAEIPLRQGDMPLQIRCLATNRKRIAPASTVRNNLCADSDAPVDERITEDHKSVVLLVRYGAFEFLHLGDLPVSEELQLVCPVNLIGEIDFLQTAAHGKKMSSSPSFLHSISPIAAWMNNASGKGGDPEVVERLQKVPGFLDVYQNHFNERAGVDRNTPRELIANIGPRESCPGHWLRLAVDGDGKSFTVNNQRNGLTRRYQVRP